MATAKTGTNKSETVSVFVPKIPGGMPSMWVGINGKSWNIPCGKRTNVPAYVAAIIHRRERNMQVAEEYAAEKQREYDAMINKFG